MPRHEDPSLVHPPRPLLAVGPGPAFFVPPHLAVAAAVPARGHRRGGRLPAHRRHLHAPGKDFGEVGSDKSLRLSC